MLDTSKILTVGGIPLTGTLVAGSPPFEALNTFGTDNIVQYASQNVATNGINGLIPVGNYGTNGTTDATWTSATALNTAVTLVSNIEGYSSIAVTLNQTGTLSAGALIFEISNDNANWYPTEGADPNTGLVIGSLYSLVIGYFIFLFSVQTPYFRVRLSTAIIGSGTLVIGHNVKSIPQVHNISGTFTGSLGATFNSVAPTLTNGSTNPLQTDINGRLLVNSNTSIVNYAGSAVVTDGVPGLIPVGNYDTTNAAAASWTSATTLNTAVTLLSNIGAYTSLTVVLNQAASGTLTGGTVIFEASLDNITWYPVQGVSLAGTTVVGPSFAFTVATITAIQFNIGAPYFRARLSIVITGTGTVTIGSNLGTLPNIDVIAGSVGFIGSLPVASVGATSVAVPTSANLEGLLATTVYPTAAASGNLVAAMADKAGRQVTVSNTVRDLLGTVMLNSASSSSVSFIVAGATGVFNDIISLIVTNESSTATVVSLSDNGAAGTVYKFALSANGGIVINFPSPLPQGTSAAAWNVLNSAAVACDYVAVYAKNK